jgi:hypothetical protein
MAEQQVKAIQCPNDKSVNSGRAQEELQEDSKLESKVRVAQRSTLFEEDFSVPLLKTEEEDAKATDDDDDDNDDEQHETKVGHVLFIPFGYLLILRADTIHAGGLCSNSTSGNPRAHVYIHKFGRGRVLAGTPLPSIVTNIYRVLDEERGGAKLDSIYKHNETAVNLKSLLEEEYTGS